MGEFEDRLDSILNNPHAMNQIMSLAQSLGISDKSQEKESPPEEVPKQEDLVLPIDPHMLSGFASLLGQNSQNDDQRVALLKALRPFVKEQRYAKLDKAIQIVKLSRMARMAFEMFKAKEQSDV